MIVSRGYFDTNILVKISLINQVVSFYNLYQKINICDQVKKEIERWNIGDFSYSHIYIESFNRIQKGYINVVNLNDFSDDDKAYIEFKANDIRSEIGKVKETDDLGEIHSVLMAQIHDAPYFCTADNKFIYKCKDRHFSDLNIKTFDNVLSELFDNEVDISKMKELADKENQKMNEEFLSIKSSGKRNQKTSLENSQLEDLLKYKQKLT